MPPARTASGTNAAGNSGEAGADPLIDRTGWADKSAFQQLQKELMPLISECVDLATARDPRLTGKLVLTMTVAPTDEGKAVIASAAAGSASEVRDAELLECIRESSLSIEGLKAARDFELSIPVAAGTGRGAPPRPPAAHPPAPRPPASRAPQFRSAPA